MVGRLCAAPRNDSADAPELTAVGIGLLVDEAVKRSDEDLCKFRRRFFEPRGKSLVPVAIAWILAQPGITAAIVGASKPEQLDDSLAAIHLSLDDEERDACNQAWFSLPRPVKPPA